MQRSLVTWWLALTLAISITGAVDGGHLVNALALAPDRIWHGQVWRLVTWPLIEDRPITLILTCISIYRFGGRLEAVWGERRLRRLVLHLVVAAGVATCLVDAVFAAGIARCGGWAVGDLLVISWARQFPTTGLNLWSALTLRGSRLVGFVVATTVIIAIFAGPTYFVPELVACIAAALYPSGWLASR